MAGCAYSLTEIGIEVWPEMLNADATDGQLVAESSSRRSKASEHPILGWTMTRLLKVRYPHVSFREAFLSNPYLEQISLAEVLETPAKVLSFLEDCRQLPHCGAKQLGNLRHIVFELQAEFQHPQERQTASGPGGGQGAELPEAAVAPKAALPVNGSFLPDFIAGWDVVYRRLFRLAHFDSFVYLPSSVPEFSKTSAVLQAELGTEAPPVDYLREMGVLRKAILAVENSDGLLMVDSRALDALFAQRGCYAQLSVKDVQDQMAMLKGMLSILPDRTEARVTDFGAARLSPCAMIGNILNCSVLGGYFVTTDQGLREEAMRRVAEGRQRSMALSDYLAQIPGES